MNWRQRASDIGRRLRAGLAKSPPLWQGQVGAAGCVGFATLVRFLFDPALHGGAPFVVYFPATVAAALWGGALAGVSAIVLSCVVATLLWSGPADAHSLVFSWPNRVAIFCVASGVLIVIASQMRSLVDALARSEERAVLLADEMQHRMRNLLATVAAIAQQVPPEATIEEYRSAFEARLQALARSQRIDAPTGGFVDLQTLLDRVIEPFGAAAFRLSGPSTDLSQDHALGLSLVVHELGTDALKHGALTSQTGHVAMEWGRDNSEIWLEWREEGGPPVSPPSRTGSGSRLMLAALGSNGEVSLDYRQEGLWCRIRLTDMGREA